MDGKLTYSKFLVANRCVSWNALRSAAAAQRLDEAGYENIACITSGLQTVKPGKTLNLEFQFQLESCLSGLAENRI